MGESPGKVKGVPFHMRSVPLRKSFAAAARIQLLKEEARRHAFVELETERIRSASNHIHTQWGSRRPEILMVLGSGLGDFADKLQDQVVTNYADIPGFPRLPTKADSHAERLVLGNMHGREIAAMQGRFHLHQGATPDEIARPIRAITALGGIKYFIVTNAAGGAYDGAKSGDIVMITDMVNDMGDSISYIPGFGARHYDASTVLDSKLRRLAIDTAFHDGIQLLQGIYFGKRGGGYETPAEVRDIMLRCSGRIGLPLAGMSTIMEILAILQFNAMLRETGREKDQIKILGLTYVSNPAAGIKRGHVLTSAEVVDAGKSADLSAPFKTFIDLIIERLPRDIS